MKNLRYPLTIFIFGLLSSAYFCAFEFIGIDDFTHITKNPNLGSVEGLLNIWKSPYFGLYAPVSYTFWWLTHLAFGSTSSAYHFLNVLFHSLNGVLVYFLLSRVLKNNKLSFIAAILFLIHPIQAASVPWVSEFRGILGAFWALLCLISLHLFFESHLKSVKWFILILMFFILATLSKPNYMFIALLIPLIWKLETKSFKDYKLFFIFIFTTSVSLVLAFLTKSQQNSPDTLLASGIEPKLILNNLGFYILHTFIPFVTQFDYGHTLEQMTQAKVWFLAWSLPFLMLLTFSLIKNKFESRLNLALLGFLFSFLPVLGLFSFGFQYYNTVADRYLYFSIIFYSGFLVVFIKHQLKAYAELALALVFTIYFAFYWLGAKDFKSEAAFAQSIVDKKSDSFVGLASLGAVQLKTGSFELSEANLLRSIDIKPDYWPAHSQLGELYETQKRWQDSLLHFQSIITNQGNKYQLIGAKNLGEFYLRVGLAQINLGEETEGLKNIELGKALAPERHAEIVKLKN